MTWGITSIRSSFVDKYKWWNPDMVNISDRWKRTRGQLPVRVLNGVDGKLGVSGHGTVSLRDGKRPQVSTLERALRALSGSAIGSAIPMVRYGVLCSRWQWSADVWTIVNRDDYDVTPQIELAPRRMHYFDLYAGR